VASTLTAGDIFGLYQGYFPDFSAGSLSPDTFGGFTCTSLVTGASVGNISGTFSGDATAFLTGKAISVDGTSYSTVASGPTYDSGSNTTSIEWAYGPGNFNTTPGSNEYTIDIGAGGGGPTYAGPSVVGVTSGVSGSGAVTVNFSSSGRAAGDMLRIAVMTANQTMATPSGWTLVVPASGDPSRGTAGAAGGVKMTVFEKVSDGTETTVSLGDSGDIQYAVGIVTRSASAYPDVIDVSIAGNVAATTSGNFTGVTTTGDDRLQLSFVATDRDFTGASWTGTPSYGNLANGNKRFDNGTATGTGGGVAIFSGEKQAAGATGNITVTQGASAAFAFITVALKNGSAPAGQSVSPSDGAILVSGDQPSVARTANQWVSPSVGHVAFGGHAPSVSQPADRSVEPSAGALFVTGDQPAVAQTAHQWVAPAKGTISTGGHVPSLDQTRNQWVAAGEGSVSFAGTQPTVDRTANQSVVPVAGALRLAGNLPVISQADNVTVQPFSGSVFLSGYSPTVLRTANIAVAPAAGELRTAGAVPAVNQTQHRFAAPVAGSMLIYGYQPAVTRNITTAVQPSHGSIYYRGKQPSVTRAVDTYVAAARGRIIINGRQPSVGEPDIIVGGLPGTACGSGELKGSVYDSVRHLVMDRARPPSIYRDHPARAREYSAHGFAVRGAVDRARESPQSLCLLAWRLCGIADRRLHHRSVRNSRAPNLPLQGRRK